MTPATTPESSRRRPRVWPMAIVFTVLFSSVSLWRLVEVNRTSGISLRTRGAVAGSDFVCPRCENLFSKLESASRDSSKGDQEVRIQLRGEPKSGTGMMSSWAVGAMLRTCELLREAYGEESCRVEPKDARTHSPDAKPGAIHKLTMVFEPQSSSGDQRCPCDTVGRVRIIYSNLQKHTLPVDKSCPWAHASGIPSYAEGCNTLDGSEPVENYADLRSCMQQSPCKITDDRFQFATMRDPRAVAVSTYFWIETHAKDVAVYAEDRVNLHKTLDESILDILESVCRWTTTRHILFNDLMQDKSTVFDYEEAETDPLEWHYRWTHLAGLHLPVAWVEDMTTLATKGAWASLTQGVNPHPGGHEAAKTRSWRDEVSPELWDDMDAVVRRWLPLGLVKRFGA